MEGLVEATAAGGHGLGTHGDSDVDGSFADLVRDVLDGFEAGGAEAVYGGGAGGVGDSGCEGGGAELVRGAGVVDLEGVSIFDST